MSTLTPIPPVLMSIPVALRTRPLRPPARPVPRPRPARVPAVITCGWVLPGKGTRPPAGGGVHKPVPGWAAPTKKRGGR
jgi:hypothetical protein